MKCRYVLALLILLTGMTGAFAQDRAKKDNTAATHDEIRALKDGLLEAIKKMDVDTLLTYLHPDVVITSQDGLEQKAIRKHEGVRDYISRQLTGPQAYIKSIQPSVIVDELTILHGDGTGIAFGSTKDHYVLANGNESDLSTRWSATLVKHDGRWKVANLHYSTNLFDNPILDGVKRMMYLVGGVALVVGLLIGLIVMKLLTRDPKPTATST